MVKNSEGFHLKRWFGGYGGMSGWKLITSKLVYNLLKGRKEPSYIGVNSPSDPKYQQDIPVPSLTAVCTWKWMVGILSRFLLGCFPFSGARTVSFRECILVYIESFLQTSCSRVLTPRIGRKPMQKRGKSALSMRTCPLLMKFKGGLRAIWIHLGWLMLGWTDFFWRGPLSGLIVKPTLPTEPLQK